MMNKVVSSILVASLAAAGSAAPAQTRTDPMAAHAITRGDFAAAEQRLVAERRIFRDRPEILLNLAAIYACTGRAPEARTLYEKVLATDDVLMDLSTDQSASSHQVAQTGLTRLDCRPTRVAGN